MDILVYDIKQGFKPTYQYWLKKKDDGNWSQRSLEPDKILLPENLRNADTQSKRRGLAQKLAQALNRDLEHGTIPILLKRYKLRLNEQGVPHPYLDPTRYEYAKEFRLDIASALEAIKSGLSERVGFAATHSLDSDGRSPEQITIPFSRPKATNRLVDEDHPYKIIAARRADILTDIAFQNSLPLSNQLTQIAFLHGAPSAQDGISPEETFNTQLAEIASKKLGKQAFDQRVAG